MSTRAIIAVPDNDQIFRGRYVHYDGYPTGAGAEAAKILHRDGFAQAVSVLIEDNLGWSTIRSDQETGAASVGKIVPGYGIAYTDGQDFFHTPANSGCGWAYVLRPEGITVWRCQGATWAIQPTTLTAT